jgi:hypothetical protein
LLDKQAVLKVVARRPHPRLARELGRWPPTDLARNPREGQTVAATEGCWTPVVLFCMRWCGVERRDYERDWKEITEAL